MASRVDFKQRYHAEWPIANARERLVLSLVESVLASIREQARRRVERAWERGRKPALADELLTEARLEARLVGYGAGSSALLPGRYRGRHDANDIAVIVNGKECCYVEVTGVCCESDLEGGPGKKLYCVGTWKLEKARKHGLLRSTWYAFTINETGKTRFIRASLLDAIAHEPRARFTVLREGEDESICVDERNWIGVRKFTKGLRAAVKRFLILQKLRGPGRERRG